MSRRRIALYCVAGAVIYVVALAAMLPAAWVSYAIERASGHRLQLRSPAGNLWTGSGRLYAMPRNGSPVELGELRWRTVGPALFAGKLAADLSLGDVARSTRVELSPGSATIRNLDLALPAKAIASLVPGLEALGPQGTLRVRTENQRIEAGSVLGQAELEWRRVRLARAPGLDLGSHVARLRGGGNKVDIELSTLEGPLRLTGSGTWTPAAGLALSGMAEHDAQQPSALATFLSGVCGSYSQNRCRFQIRLDALAARTP